jgi:hypothetical protein
MPGAGIEGHAALVVDDNESRTIDSNVGSVIGRGSSGRGPDVVLEAFV